VYSSEIQSVQTRLFENQKRGLLVNNWCLLEERFMGLGNTWVESHLRATWGESWETKSEDP